MLLQEEETIPAKPEFELFKKGLNLDAYIIARQNFQLAYAKHLKLYQLPPAYFKKSDADF